VPKETEVSIKDIMTTGKIPRYTHMASPSMEAPMRTS
jgi:hypothetical protein